MTHITISLAQSGPAPAYVRITADRDIEPPLLPAIHSIGGGIGIPKHDRRAHAEGRPHECSRVRSATLFVGTIHDLQADREVLAEQYQNHEITWRNWP